MKRFISFFLVTAFSSSSFSAVIGSNGKTYSSFEAAVEAIKSTCNKNTHNSRYRGVYNVRVGTNSITYTPYDWQNDSCTAPYGYAGSQVTITFTEDACGEMEGESLGTVTFPEGTRDVASLCRNSCRANSDLFFPAATPPYGVFTYTGSSCDGSESSGGETGGGSTDGDGLTKAQLQDALQSFFGKSGSFNAPGQGDGYATNTVLTTAVDDLKTEID
ncbi:hypothetical protein AB4289_19720, partial [Vibrio cyclitrophicus]